MSETHTPTASIPLYAIPMETDNADDGGSGCEGIIVWFGEDDGDAARHFRRYINLLTYGTPPPEFVKAEGFTCEHCGHQGLDVGLYVDPYIQELGSAEEVAALEDEYWCDDCYGQRADDI